MVAPPVACSQERSALQSHVWFQSLGQLDHILQPWATQHTLANLGLFFLISSLAPLAQDCIP